MGARADIVATGVQCASSESRFTVESHCGTQKIVLPYLGEFNVENALCAIGIGLACGVDLATIAEALSKAAPVPGRMAPVEAGQPFRVIVDYAHTPESLHKVMSLLRRLHEEGRIICVSGSAGERDRTKRPMQGRVSAELADVSVFTTEDPRFEDAEAIIDEIAAGAMAEGARDGSDFVRIVDRQEAIDFAMRAAGPGDIVLLAGKGHERSIVWGHEKRPWDEAAAARLALERAGYGKVAEE
jgi:UDP-N-acetylmuramoyl-L-alanyl-D-glutamate--2,6-diaminopimelate ligase